MSAFDTREWVALDVCTDCLMIIANDDDSGISDPAAHREWMFEVCIAQGITHLTDLIATGEELGFCHATRCDTCGSSEAGDRYRAWQVV